MVRESRTGRKIFFVARSLCAGRKIFLWQEASAPGGRFFCGKRVPNRVQALIKLIIFLISSFPFLRSPFFLFLFPFLRSPFFLFLFPFLRSPFFLFFRSPLFSCVFLHFVLSAYEKLLCRNKSASLVTV